MIVGYPALVALLSVVLAHTSKASRLLAKHNEVLRETKADFRHFDYIVTNYMRERRVPGASFAVSKNGEFVIRKGFGRASTQRLMTPWSLFRIGSVSKTVTAAAILRLHQQERLSLDAAVFGSSGLLRQYELSERSDPRIPRITVRNLLHHSTGWDPKVVGDPLMHRDLPDVEDGDKVALTTQEQIVRFMLRQPLQFTPGTRYAYNNVGYLLLGLVIEKVTGKTYEQAVRGMLWEVGVYRMTLGRTYREQSALSEVEYFSRYPSDQVSSIDDHTVLVPPPYGGFSMEIGRATFGWTSSAEDLVRFMNSLDGTGGPSSELLNQTTFKLMVNDPGFSEVESKVWYGMGLVVQDDGASYWHSGVLEGSTSILAHNDDGYTWAALLNYKLENNDLIDLVKYAIRKAITPQFDVANATKLSSKSYVALFADSLTEDGSNMVKMMIPDFKLDATIAALSSKRYRLEWIDAYEEYGYVFFNTIWKKNDGTKWKAYVDMTSAKYRKRYKARVAQGYRLAQIETYVSRRRLRYAAIFVRDVWPEWVTYDGFSPHRHKTQFFKYLEAGYRLVVQSVTEFRGHLYVAAIYDRIHLGEYRVRMGLTLEEYSLEMQRQLSSGRILSYVQAYEHQGVVKFSAIWTPSTTKAWASSHAVTKYTLLNKLNGFASVNVPLRCLTAYLENDVITFAALWR